MMMTCRVDEEKHHLIGIQKEGTRVMEAVVTAM
jgi:hypothetical protein